MNTDCDRARIAVATGRHRFALPGVAVAVAVALAAVSAGAWAANTEKNPEKKAPVEFENVRLIIEFNATDEDVGVQFFLDVDSWLVGQDLQPGRQGDLRRPKQEQSADPGRWHRVVCREQ